MLKQRCGVGDVAKSSPQTQSRSAGIGSRVHSNEADAIINASISSHKSKISADLTSDHNTASKACDAATTGRSGATTTRDGHVILTIDSENGEDSDEGDGYDGSMCHADNNGNENDADVCISSPLSPAISRVNADATTSYSVAVADTTHNERVMFTIDSEESENKNDDHANVDLNSKKPNDDNDGGKNGAHKHGEDVLSHRDDDNETPSQHSVIDLAESQSSLIIIDDSEPKSSEENAPL